MNELFRFEVGKSGAELITEEDQSGEMNAVLVLAKISSKLKRSAGRGCWGAWGEMVRVRGVRVGGVGVHGKRW